jgi:energy-coupling factor transporter transmembrane protein EcfT
LDPRLKLAAIAIIGFLSLNAEWKKLALLTLLVLWWGIRVRLSLFSILKDMRYFLLLLCPIWGIRSSTVGMYDATLVCWRIILAAYAGINLMATTRTWEIRAALRWFFKPIPFVPEKRLSAMISLMMRFLPMILRQSGEISDAQKARGIECRKNPIYRMSRFVLPLTRRTFEDADHLIVAMEARSYCEDRTEPELSHFSRSFRLDNRT